ncbi:MAG: hypothetical protein IT289_12445 [Oligoflexia bacterium]|nr:hypothetical protein [Oligoflexia bacterium]
MLRTVIIIFFVFIGVLACTNGILQELGQSSLSTNCSLNATNFVLGQSSFSTNSAGSSNAGLSSPGGVACYANKVLVADTASHRVMIWNNPSSNGPIVDVVLGHLLTSGNAVNDGVGTQNYTFNIPNEVAVAGSRVIVSDESNQRVLVWNSFPTYTGQPADLVLGQTTFTGNSVHGGASPDYWNFWSPNGVYWDGNKLFVASRSQNRIMIWNSFPTNNAQPADVIVGQPDGTSTGGATTASGLTQPRRVFSDGTRLYVSDSSNNRVLIWNNIPTSDGTPADVVLGQPNFISNTSNNGGLSASSLSSPQGLYSDGEKLWVVDSGTRRILVWNSSPSSNFTAANAVYGQQGSFTTGLSNNPSLGYPGLSSPQDIFRVGTSFLIADTSNNRVLYFPPF